MHKINTFRILQLLLGVCLSYQEVVPGCPRFSAMPNVDLNQHIHHWIQNSAFTTRFKCLHVHWTLGENSDSPQINETVHLTSIETNQTAVEIHTAFVKDVNRPVKWFVNERNTDFDVNILYTDYSYSLWSQCSHPSGEEVSIKIFMASRYDDRVFPGSLVKQFEAVLVGDYDANYMHDYWHEVPQGPDLCNDVE